MDSARPGNQLNGSFASEMLLTADGRVEGGIAEHAAERQVEARVVDWK